MRDITERLRGLVPHCEDHADYTEDDLLILQSAKEIERLREEVEDMRKLFTMVNAAALKQAQPVAAREKETV